MTGADVTRRTFLDGSIQFGVAASLPLIRQAQPPSRRTSFDGGWRFFRGDPSGAQSQDFADHAWTALDLPHDWSIAGPYGPDQPTGSSGGYLPTGVGWYRKRFNLPPATRGMRVLVEFDGVYQRSEVWINGRPLGLRPNGYISFIHDLTPHLNPPGTPNLVAVRVDNSLQPNSRWYSGSGIYRHTWLWTLDPLHIPPRGVVARVLAISSDRATIHAGVRVLNGTDRPSACSLSAVVRDRNGAAICDARLQAEIGPGGEHTFEPALDVTRPELWSVSTPTLYSLETTLQSAGRTVDTASTTFGIREARFDPDRGFLLNGERVKLNGACLHHDGGAVGAAVPERVWERRLASLKEMGCNAIRTSHGPPAPEFLDLCDAMGFLVMDEAFDEWRQPKLQTPQYGYHRYFDDWAKIDVASMIERDRNHPSIVIWSAGNEVPDQTDPRGPETLQALLDVFHAMDPTRPVTVACDNIVAEPKAALPAFLQELDVVGYNYVDRWRDRRETYYSADRHNHPGRIMLGTESTALGGVRGAYRLEDDAPVFGEQTTNRRIEVEQLQKFVQAHDYVAGDFMWTGIDYLGEAAWPAKAASSGVLDTCGFRKDGFYFYQSQWTAKPVLHLFPHWNWHGREGEVVTVCCYTNCDTVELFLNGKSFGVKGYAFPRPGMMTRYGVYPPRAGPPQTTADLHLAWDVPYAPGELRAVGVKDGQVVATTKVVTTGEPYAIRLTVDRNRIGTGRHDVAHVTVEIVDRDGLPSPTAEDEIAFEVKGAGRIVGVDNGRPDSHESFQANRRKAFNGLALVLLQSTGRPGDMVLSASGASLQGANVSVTGVRS